MNVRSTCFSLGLVVATAGITAFVVQAQDKKMPSKDEIMKMYEESAKPGPEHVELMKTAGHWTSECTCYFDGTPTKSTGAAEFEPILGGRYLLERMKGDMGGQPFEGMQILGFDNVAKQHFSIWIDSMGTGYMPMTGKKGAGNAMEYKGTAKDVMTPNGRPFRFVEKQVSADEFMIEMYDTMPGQDGKMQEMKVMDGTYKRAAKRP